MLILKLANLAAATAACFSLAAPGIYPTAARGESTHKALRPAAAALGSGLAAQAAQQRVQGDTEVPPARWAGGRQGGSQSSPGRFSPGFHTGVSIEQRDERRPRKV